MSAKLFTPFSLRESKIRNRIWMSPMCQYSAEGGVPNDWHRVHLGTRATGGVGLIMVEASGVSAEGRITPGDMGIWNDKQVEAFKPILAFCQSQGATMGIQLAHAGRKASCAVPWQGGKSLSAAQGGWTPVAPSAIAFSPDSPTPRALNTSEISGIVESFVQSAKRALSAGFEIVEIHAAHGYLLHEFLSPLSNQRTDEYGGSLANRMRLPLEVAKAVRDVWPQKWPVFMRISATDWVESGWDLPSSIALSHELKKIGLDLVDVSSGGAVPHAKIPNTPHYQVPFAEAIRRDVKIPVAAVGLITEVHGAEKILQDGQADAVFLARELLRHPYWALHAAHALQADVTWPNQYARAQPVHR